MAPQSPPQKPSLQGELEKKMRSIAAKGKEREAESLARELGLPFSNLAGVPVDPDALILVPEDIARASGLAVLYKSGATLVIAILDPRNQETQKTLEGLKSRSFALKLLVTSLEAMETVWKRYETTRTAEVFEVGAIEIAESELDRLQAQIETLSDLKNQLDKVSATKLLEILIAGALKTRASDIHFEPEPGKTRLRYRLDGLLQDVTFIDPVAYGKVLNRVKILSKMKLNIRKAPQDGRFTIRQKEVEIEVRVSVLPSEYGESIVMRLLDPRTIEAKIETLGMRPDILTTVKEELAKPNGTLLTTGPTGSGKTTTLYAFINFLNTPDMKIITVEDPIEYHIEGISQTNVEPSKGYTFATGLRAIVRQDPDVILIGEIRDLETADIALNAALTGHMVLSTIHTNDAAGTVPRLIDIGVRPEIIAPAVTMAMGQRLVRRLCPECKKEGQVPAEELSKIRDSVEPISKRFGLPPVNDKLKIYFPGKCKACNEIGYKGRVGVYEVLRVTKTMERLIMKSPGVSDVRDQAISDGMVTMLQDGYLKLIEGLTSLEEIRRVLG